MFHQLGITLTLFYTQKVLSLSFSLQMDDSSLLKLVEVAKNVKVSFRGSASNASKTNLLHRQRVCRTSSVHGRDSGSQLLIK